MGGVLPPSPPPGCAHYPQIVFTDSGQSMLNIPSWPNPQTVRTYNSRNIKLLGFLAQISVLKVSHAQSGVRKYDDPFHKYDIYSHVNSTNNFVSLFI